jgi:hypothetical protein
MKRRKKNIVLVAVLTLSCGWVAGCDAEFIAREAQQALATFLTGVVTTAINETVAPD